MEKARIFHAEDDPESRISMKRFLERHGHIVTQVANREEGITTIEKMEIPWDLGLLDGNLSRRASDCFDGITLEILLRSKIPNIFVIAFSASRNIPFGDMQIDKSDYTQSEKILNAISALNPPQ